MYRGRKRGSNNHFGNRNLSVNTKFNSFGGQKVSYSHNYQQQQQQHQQRQQNQYQATKPTEARPQDEKKDEDRKAMVRTSDGDIFVIDVGAMATESVLFRDMRNFNQNNENGIIRLPVCTAHLVTIIKYIGYYKDTVVHSLNAKLDEYECGKFTSSWDFELFRDLSHPQIKKLQESAWILGFQRFAALCHKKIAMDIKYYNQIRIRRVHEMYDDFTNEEDHVSGT